ncbi:uncharacterized protein TNCV_2369831 [Trichonephila clavipes]|nr:uncharacterized protein TNCV_2369831 [Trichonephila clavipes]
MAYRWCTQFSEGRHSAHDEERIGRPSLINVDLAELVRQSVMENRRFMITELSSQFPQISRSLLHEIVTKQRCCREEKQFIAAKNSILVKFAFESSHSLRGTAAAAQTTVCSLCNLNGACLKRRLKAVSISSELTRGSSTAGSDVVQFGRPIFDDFFQHLWPYIGNNTANVVFQMVKRLWLIRIDQ